MKKDKILEKVFNAVEGSGLSKVDVNFVYLFGSYIDNPQNARDIDVCVSLDTDNPKQFEMKIDGRISDEIDISVFESLPLHIKKQVFSGELLYSRDNSVYDEAFETFRDFQNFKPLYRTAIGC